MLTKQSKRLVEQCLQTKAYKVIFCPCLYTDPDLRIRNKNSIKNLPTLGGPVIKCMVNCSKIVYILRNGYGAFCYRNELFLVAPGVAL